MMEELLNKIKFNSEGLVPAVIQDLQTDRVLMVAYMNEESLRKTLETGKTVFWSRSRKSLWKKGETSGNDQTVREIYLDCDEDALLIKVDQKNAACHTGHLSCFYRKSKDGRILEIADERGAGKKDPENILERLYSVILQRKKQPVQNSYVSSLFSGGQDSILKKVSEEAGEVILSSKNQKNEEIVWEVADLWFHSLMVLGFHGIPLEDILAELAKREGKPGLKNK